MISINEAKRLVKRALLAMQRHNWEQGVTAQAFLEAGDEDIAIALALEGAKICEHCPVPRPLRWTDIQSSPRIQTGPKTGPL